MSNVGQKNVHIHVTDLRLILDLAKLGESFKLVDFGKYTPFAAQMKSLICRFKIVLTC